MTPEDFPIGCLVQRWTGPESGIIWHVVGHRGPYILVQTHEGEPRYQENVSLLPLDLERVVEVEIGTDRSRRRRSEQRELNSAFWYALNDVFKIAEKYAVAAGHPDRTWLRIVRRHARRIRRQMRELAG